MWGLKCHAWPSDPSPFHDPHSASGVMLTHWQKSGNSKLCLDTAFLAPTNKYMRKGVKAPTDCLAQLILNLIPSLHLFCNLRPHTMYFMSSNVGCCLPSACGLLEKHNDVSHSSGRKSTYLSKYGLSRR